MTNGMKWFIILALFVFGILIIVVIHDRNVSPRSVEEQKMDAYTQCSNIFGQNKSDCYKMVYEQPQKIGSDVSTKVKVEKSTEIWFLNGKEYQQLPDCEVNWNNNTGKRYNENFCRKAVYWDGLTGYAILKFK